MEVGNRKSFLNDNREVKLHNWQADNRPNFKFKMTVWVHVPKMASREHNGRLLCHFCSNEIHDADFHIHMKQYHKKAFMCGICGLFFMSKYDLSNHNRRKCRQGSSLCTAKLKYTTKKMQFISTCENNKYSCKLCRKSFTTNTQLHAHYKIHSSRQNYKCTVGCNHNFLTKASFDKHLNSHFVPACSSKHSGSRESIQNKYPIKCFLCDTNFTSVSSLQQHIKLHNHGEFDEVKFTNNEVTNDSDNFMPVTLEGTNKEKVISFQSVGKINPTEISERNDLSDNKNIKSNRQDNVDEKSNENKSLLKCGICDFISDCHIQLKSHEKTHITSYRLDSKTQKYLCDKCDKTFPTLSRLKDHMRKHLNKREFKCDQCNKSYNYRTSLQKHKVTHSDNFFHCDICPKKFKVEAALKKHKMIHTDDRPFCCDVCGKRFTDCNDLRQHKLRVHKGRFHFHCEVCGSTFKSKMGLTTHMYVHTGERPFSCDLCGNKFRCKSTLVEHTRFVHEGERPFTCEKCGSSFRKQHTLKHHTMTAHSDGVTVQQETRSFSCEICGRCFIRKSNLMDHLRFVHSADKSLKCEECGKSLRHEQALRQHMKTHNTEFLCNVCGRCCASQSALKQHMFTHTGEQPFKCSVCDRKFNRNANLLQHTRIHSGEKPYTCEICAASFNHIGTLKRHKLSHTNEKPCVCPTCGMSFRDKCNMRTHMLRHSGLRPFECDECGKSFRQSHHLKTHKITHLPKEERDCNVDDSVQCADKMGMYGVV